MSTEEFTEELCEELFLARKYVASQIVWRAKGDYRCAFKATVLTQDGRGLDLYGFWCRNGRYGRTTWGFNLSYNGRCIRSYDMGKKHKNPGGSKVHGPHKHRFSSSKIDRLAYKPNPPISEENPNAALLDFLKEANIDAPTDYQHFLFP